MNTLTQQQIIETLKNTPKDYMTKSLEQRNPGPLSAGSTFHKTQTLDSLCEVEWVRFEDPDCGDPAISFRGSLPGKLGIASLENDGRPMSLVALRYSAFIFSFRPTLFQDY